MKTYVNERQAMARKSQQSRAPLLALAVDRDSTETLQDQLFRQISDIILSGRLPPGTRLPSSRALASDLGVSRNTVTAVFDRLMSEGYSEGRTGSGTCVSRDLPMALLDRNHSAASVDGPDDVADSIPVLSRQGQRVLATVADHPRGKTILRPGHSGLQSFPFAVWNRLLQKYWRAPDRHQLLFPEIGGHPPLRQQIARYLASERGLNCRPEQIIVTSGSQQALDMTARLLVDPGQKVWLEDPCYGGLKAAFQAVGAKIEPIRVDQQGLSVSEARKVAGDAVLAAVTPSHQYPLGVVMNLSRRLELLDWANVNQSWILEDDYDSEFRYSGRPLSALQGLDKCGRVIYAGTFSRIMFPAIRLGYLVVPEKLLPSFLKFSSLLYGHAPLALQPAMAEFMRDGHFSAHIRRMRGFYKQRQQWMINAIKSHLGNFIEAEPDPAGMHLLARIVEHGGRGKLIQDQELSKAAASIGVSVMALSAMYDTGAANKKQGLILGYGGLPEKQMDRAFARLKTSWQKILQCQ